eukprot:5191059-Amphidinium_carterae.1
MVNRYIFAKKLCAGAVHGARKRWPTHLCWPPHRGIRPLNTLLSGLFRPGLCLGAFHTVMVRPGLPPLGRTALPHPVSAMSVSV